MLVNPKDRLTADQIMSHPWLADEDSQTQKNMPEVQEALNHYKYKMKWRKAANTIKATIRFKKVIALKM